MTNPVEFKAPTGRLVWGDPATLQQKTDSITGAKRTNADGTPMMECAIGVAYAKVDPLAMAFIETLRAADRAAYPNFHGPDGKVLPGVEFADKFTDGDGVVAKGKKAGQSYASRDGYAGHIVVKYASQFLPTNYSHDGAKWVQRTDAFIKPGDYVQVSGTTSPNNSTQSPGMYRNLNMVAFVGHGVPIVRAGGDPDAVFGVAPPAMPAGATATPQAPATPVPTAAPAAPAAAPSAPVASGAPASPTAAPPYSGFMQPPTAPAAPAVRQMRGPDGAVYPYDTLTAAGWTDATLAQHGYVAA